MAETVGFIGLGVMGKPMAKHLIQKGYRLSVHSRSPAPVAELTALGAERCDRPVAVAEASDVIITMLPDTPDVEMVLTGDDGVLSGLRERAVVIDMSSISPVVTKRLSTQITERGGAMLDAPVSGGEVGAVNA